MLTKIMLFLKAILKSGFVFLLAVLQFHALAIQDIMPGFISALGNVILKI